MKFLALFVAGALAASVKRATGGIEAVTQALGDVANRTDGLTEAVSTFHDGGDLANILDATVHLRSALGDANSVVEATNQFNISEATSLITPTQTLATSVENSINATIAKIPEFEANNLIAEVRYQLTVLNDTSTVLQTNLINLVPDSLKSTAETLAAPITANLARGLSAFNNASDASTNAAFMPSPNLQMGGMVAVAGLAFLVL